MKLMNKSVYVLSGLFVLLAGFCAFYLYQQSPKIALLDMERVIAESTPGKAGREHLNQIDQRFRQGMIELGNNYKNASAEEQQQVLNQAEETLTRQFSHEERAVTDIVTSIILDEAEKWRSKHGITIILPSHLVLAADRSGTDCTNEVLDAVNKRVPKFADLPVMTINKPPVDQQNVPAILGGKSAP